MDVKNIRLKNNHFRADFYVPFPSNTFKDEVSEEFVLGEALNFQLRVLGSRVNLGGWSTFYLYIKLSKRRGNDTLTYSVRFTSTEFNIKDERLVSDGHWQLLHKEEKANNCLFSVSVSAQAAAVAPAITFAALFDNTALTDFELRAIDGGVPVHRTALAAASPVLCRMLEGDWREAAQGHADIADVSANTLRHLKQYIYLNKLPDTGVEQLLLIAARFMMSDLEKLCVHRLVSDLTAENALELTEFAAKHKLTELLLAIFGCVQCGLVMVEDIRDHCERTHIKTDV